MKLVIAIVLIIMLFLIIPVASDNDARIAVDDIMNNKLSGEKLDGNALNAIKKIKKIKDKNAEDYSNLGNLYACHINTPIARIRAFNNYTNALCFIHKGKTKEKDATSILYRMENIINKKDDSDILAGKRERHTFPALFRQKLLPIIADEQRRNHERIINKAKMANPTVNNLLNKKVWKSDSQNVHDSAILHDLKSQFNHIRDQNNIICPKYTFEQVKNSILGTGRDKNANSRENIAKVLQRIGNNGKVLGLDVEERGFLIEVWRRIQSPVNGRNKKELEQALLSSLLDCIENGSIVCSAGRNTHILSSLAILDRDSKTKGIGILKSKEAIRNEIFEASAKIVEKYIGKSSKVPKPIIEDYNAGISNAGANELKENIRMEILDLKGNFSNRNQMDEIRIKQILDECVAVL